MKPSGRAPGTWDKFPAPGAYLGRRMGSSTRSGHDPGGQASDAGDAWCRKAWGEALAGDELSVGASPPARPKSGSTAWTGRPVRTIWAESGEAVIRRLGQERLRPDRQTESGRWAVIRRLGKGGQELAATIGGPRAREEYKTQREDYIRLMTEEMIPLVAREARGVLRCVL